MRKNIKIGIILSIFGLFFVFNNVFAIGSLDSFSDYGFPNASTRDISNTAEINTSITAPEIIGLAIKVVLGLVGTICLIIVVISGINWIKAKGSAPEIAEARKKIAAALGGLIITIAAYSITDFVLKQISVTVDQGSAKVCISDGGTCTVGTDCCSGSCGVFVTDHYICGE